MCRAYQVGRLHLVVWVWFESFRSSWACNPNTQT
ncbi:hypothetical protein RSAG8_10125, partial [Rhizoctonia solani AG-8 WAC10335]